MKKLWMSIFNLRAHLGDARSKVTIVALLTIFTWVPLFSAMAQENDSFMLEEITVTGSRIRGVEGVGTSVVGIDREDMEMSAGVSVDLMIKEIPSVMDLGITESAKNLQGGEDNRTLSNSINIHGIGSYATLTLLDGHRVTSNGRSVSASMLPSLGLERIEVVADGASAIYGSDAVAGVVNLIPRRSLNGVDASLRYVSAADNEQYQAGAAVGKMWDSGQFMVAYERSFRGSLSGRDRDFYRADLTPWGGGDYRITSSSPGTITAGGRGTPYPETTFAIPEGGLTTENVSDLEAGTVNLYDPTSGKYLLPEQESNNTMITFNQTFGNIEFFGDAFYAKREFITKREATAKVLTVYNTNAWFVPLPGMEGLTSYKVDLNYDDIPGVSETNQVGYSKNWEISPGFRFDLPRGFQFEAQYTNGSTRNRSSLEGAANDATLITAALRSSDPATAWDVYSLGRTSQEVIDSVSTGWNVNETEGDLQVYEASINGPVFDLPGGTMALAAGYEGQRFEMLIHTVTGNYPDTVNTDREQFFELGRDVDSGYIELYVPIFGRKNARTGFNRLELTAALRHDEYSDVGGTTNPKIGFNYSPFESLMFNGSYGTSFRAPLLDELSKNYLRLWPNRYQLPDSEATVNALTIDGGNEDLTPETSTNWSLGVTYDFTTDTRIQATFFSVDYTDKIDSYLTNLSILAIEEEFAGSTVIRRGTTEDGGNAGPYAVILDEMGVSPGKNGWPDDDPNMVDLLIDGRPMNLGQSLIQGIDFTINHTLRTDSAGSFKFNFNGTLMTTYEVRYTAGGSTYDLLNQIYNPLRFKARGGVTWSYSPFTTQVSFRYVHKYDNTAVTPTEEVDSWMPIDLLLRLNGDDVDWLGSFGTGLSVSLEARNVFDLDPPYVNIAQSRNGGGGFDPSAADPIGRTFGISLRKRF